MTGSDDGSIRLNISIHRIKHPRTFEAIRYYKEKKIVLSNKFCEGLVKLYEEELKGQKLESFGLNDNNIPERQQQTLDSLPRIHEYLTVDDVKKLDKKESHDLIRTLYRNLDLIKRVMQFGDDEFVRVSRRQLQDLIMEAAKKGVVLEDIEGVSDLKHGTTTNL
jgi:hypothetical protein